jgi:hypothetical protein
MAVSFIGGGNRGTQRKPPTCRKSLTNLITWCCIEYTSSWMEFELTTLVVIDIDCTDNCFIHSNWHVEFVHHLGIHLELSVTVSVVLVSSWKYISHHQRIFLNFISLKVKWPAYIRYIIRGTQRKPPTCRKSLTNLIIYCCIEYTSSWMEFEITTLVVIRIDCTDNCKSNYHRITTAPWQINEGE